MILLLWLFQVVFLGSFYRAIKVGDIKSTADKISGMIDSSSLESYISGVALRGESNITVTDLEGNRLYSSRTDPNNLVNGQTAEDYKSFISQAQKSGGSYSEWLNDNGSRGGPVKPQAFPEVKAPPGAKQANSISYTKIVIKKSGTKVAVIINANISPVDATVATIRTQLVCVTFIMLVFALLLAFLISRKISKPIIKFNKSAKELAMGNYDIKFDGKGYREITELGGTLNYAAGELGKTEALRRDLIANISHDLRTPLTMITGYAEVMRDLPGENSPENVQVIIDEASRLTSLVNNVLDISKLESSAEDLKLSVFDLTESVRNILKRYKKLTGQEGYTIKFISDGHAFINGDELRVSQVIYNLVNNAINYTGPDKLIIVRQSMRKGRVRIEVIDTGDGIDEEKLPLIWDRYYKVDKQHRRAAVGSGLGLSIVKTILEKHNALYGVQSAKGQGSIFWFEFKTAGTSEK